METYEFYIDKRKNSKYNSDLTVLPDHPIISNQEDHIIKIKLVDFKFLNNIYNISSSLVNNQFNIRRTSKTYTYEYGGSVLYIDDTGFYDNQNVLIATQTIDGTNNTDTITKNELSLVYFHPLINEISYWVNILNSTYDTSRKMEIQQNTKYFEIITSENTRIESFNITLYKDSYTGTPVPIVIKLQRFNTTTSVYDDINVVNTQFFGDVLEEYKVLTLTYTNPQPTNKYRIITDTGSLPFILYVIKLNANKQIPVYDAGTEDTPVEHTITIPDGFYKASNFKKTLNDLLTTYKIKVSIGEYTNKLKFSNENPTFSPTVDDLIYDNFKLDLVIPNINNMKQNLGITINSYQPYIPIPFNSYYEADTNINLMNFTKIIITTNLSFKNKTHNEILNDGNPYCKSFGNILTWVDTDEAPFTCIKYNNYEQIEYEIINDHIDYISFRFYNEKSQELHLDNCLMHFQIKKEYINKINDNPY